jgi:hypothetical protein
MWSDSRELSRMMLRETSEMMTTQMTGRVANYEGEGGKDGCRDPVGAACLIA